MPMRQLRAMVALMSPAMATAAALVGGGPACQKGGGGAAPAATVAAEAPASATTAPVADAARPLAGRAGCAEDPRVTPWRAGLRIAGAAHAVEVVSTLPPGAQAAGRAAPTMGKNTLTVALTDAKGAPAAEASLHLAASMPDHGHGAAPVQGRREGGHHVFEQLDLFMPGVWQFDFLARRPGQADDTATVTLCIDG